MNPTVKEMEEFRQDMLLDNYKCYTHKCSIRNDYNYFRKYYTEEFEVATKAIKVLTDLHKEYGHPFSLEEIR